MPGSVRSECDGDYGIDRDNTRVASEALGVSSGAARDEGEASDSEEEDQIGKERKSMRPLEAGWSGQDADGYTLTVTFATAQEVDGLCLDDPEECRGMCEVLKDALGEIRKAGIVEGEECTDAAE